MFAQLGNEVTEPGVAEGAEAVVDRDHDDVTDFGEPRPVVDGGTCGPEHAGSTMEPHHDRQGGFTPGRCPDVQDETVLGRRVGVLPGRIVEVGLRGRVSQRGSGTNAIPGGGRERGQEPQVSYWRCRVGNPEERVDRAKNETLEDSVVDAN